MSVVGDRGCTEKGKRGRGEVAVIAWGGQGQGAPVTLFSAIARKKPLGL